MKLDAHVHTHYSGMTTIWPLSLVMRESYNTPERVYALAKARGMDLVAITDHDTIAVRSRWLTCLMSSSVRGVGEVPWSECGRTSGRARHHRASIPSDQHAQTRCLRTVVVPAGRGDFTVVNHVASQVNGRLTPTHIAALLPWVDGFRSDQRFASASPEQNGVGAGGVVEKIRRRRQRFAYRPRIGRTWTVVDGATTRAEFMAGLRSGRGRAGGRQGHYFTMASDMLRFAGRFYAERAVNSARHPLEWRRHLFLLCSVLCLPLVMLPLIGAVAHFIEEAASTSRCSWISWHVRLSHGARPWRRLRNGQGGRVHGQRLWQGERCDHIAASGH